MKKCPLCENFPVVKWSGFCYKHNKIYKKQVREFKKMFIQFMLEKQTMDARNGLLKKQQLAENSLRKQLIE